MNSLENVTWHNHVVNREMRSKLNSQKPCVLWFTGLSGAGKSTMANALDIELHRRGQRTYLLDGDNVRHGLNGDLGFSNTDRIENIRRVGEVSRLFVDAGLIVLSAFISPFRSDRRMVRELFSDAEFVEIYVGAPLSVCEGRDPKGLYSKARKGEIENFTGIDSPYEIPEKAELVIDSSTLSVDECVVILVDFLLAAGYLDEGF